MFKVALRAFVSDIRTTFQGWAMWIVLGLCAFLIGVLPMVGDVKGNVWASCVYGMGVTVVWLSPRFTRSFHVVPFTIGQIRKLAVYRCIIFIGSAMIVGGIFLALAAVFSWDWNPGFGMWYFSYVEIYFVITKERLAGFLPKKYKTNIWLGIWTGIVAIASIFIMVGIAEALPLYVQYLIQAGLLLLFLPYPITILKNMDFHDYRQVRDSVGARPSFLE